MIDPNEISLKAVKRASKIANLHNFVTNDLSKKYQTIIGERGVRLSGGQRQRIGIARALYHNPKMLILDEATSALDNQTEKAVMDAVNNLNKSITIILIAHRLSTVKKCDNIFILENGKIKNQGTFKELIKVDKNFRLNAQNYIVMLTNSSILITGGTGSFGYSFVPATLKKYNPAFSDFFT